MNTFYYVLFLILVRVSAEGKVTVAADIYAFGICALEMAVLEIQGNGDSRHISRQAIKNAVDQVDDPPQKVRMCPPHTHTSLFFHAHSILLQFTLTLVKFQMYVTNIWATYPGTPSKTLSTRLMTHPPPPKKS